MQAIRYYIILFVLCLNSRGFAQNSLTGIITDSTSHSPVEGAVVYIPDLKVAAQTKAEGKY
jgi:iron complex outermembrane receptor protein